MTRPEDPEGAPEAPRPGDPNADSPPDAVEGALPEGESLPPDAEPSEAPRPSTRLAVDRRMLEMLVCPVTQAALDYDREAQELISRQAALAFPIREGIPILLVAEARRLEL